MPKKINIPTPQRSFGKVPVVLELDRSLVSQIDRLAMKAHLSRSTAITILASISLSMVEQLLDPAKWLNDPLLVSILEKHMSETVSDSSTEK